MDRIIKQICRGISAGNRGRFSGGIARVEVRSVWGVLGGGAGRFGEKVNFEGFILVVTLTLQLKRVLSMIVAMAEE